MIECKICSRPFERLGRHVGVHGLSLREYEKRFPGARTSEPMVLTKKEAEVNPNVVVVKNEKKYSDKVCVTCGRPLLKLPWGVNDDRYILVCNNTQCQRYRQPQGSGGGKIKW